MAKKNTNKNEEARKAAEAPSADTATVEAPPVTEVIAGSGDPESGEVTAESGESTEEAGEPAAESVTHPVLKVTNGELVLVDTPVVDWQNPTSDKPFANEIGEFKLTDAEGLGKDQCQFFVGAEEVKANSKGFKLGNAVDKCAEIWTQDDEDDGTLANKRLIPTMKVGDLRYPHVIRTEDGCPVLLKSSKEAEDEVTTGQDKAGVLIRCLNSGTVMRVWTSDLHQTCRTRAEKKKHDKRKKVKAKRVKPVKVAAPAADETTDES